MVFSRRWCSPQLENNKATRKHKNRHRYTYTHTRAHTDMSGTTEDFMRWRAGTWQIGQRESSRAHSSCVKCLHVFETGRSEARECVMMGMARGTWLASSRGATSILQQNVAIKPYRGQAEAHAHTDTQTQTHRLAHTHTHTHIHSADTGIIHTTHTTHTIHTIQTTHTEHSTNSVHGPHNTHTTYNTHNTHNTKHTQHK